MAEKIRVQAHERRPPGRAGESNQIEFETTKVSAPQRQQRKGVERLGGGGVKGVKRISKAEPPEQ